MCRVPPHPYSTVSHPSVFLHSHDSLVLHKLANSSYRKMKTWAMEPRKPLPAHSVRTAHKPITTWCIVLHRGPAIDVSLKIADNITRLWKFPVHEISRRGNSPVAAEQTTTWWFQTANGINLHHLLCFLHAANYCGDNLPGSKHSHVALQGAKSISRLCSRYSNLENLIGKSWMDVDALDAFQKSAF